MTSEPIDWEEQAQLKTQFEEEFSMKNGHIFKDRSANKTPKEMRKNRNRANNKAARASRKKNR
jgi:hypothetical protein